MRPRVPVPSSWSAKGQAVPSSEKDLRPANDRGKSAAWRQLQRKLLVGRDAGKLFHNASSWPAGLLDNVQPTEDLPALEREAEGSVPRLEILGLAEVEAYCIAMTLGRLAQRYADGLEGERPGRADPRQRTTYGRRMPAIETRFARPGRHFDLPPGIVSLPPYDYGMTLDRL
jgi:hypothetical protein